MSRTLSAGLTSHLAGRAHTRCNMLLLVLRNGTKIGVTDHDKDIVFDVLGDGDVTYQAGTGILTSDVSLSAGLDADNYEVTGPIGPVVDLDGVVGGYFNRARAFLFQVNWKDTSLGAIKLLRGNVSEARVEGGKFIFEVRSDADRFNQVVGRTITNNCPWDHGDANCGRVPESVVGTVTSVTDEMRFSVSYTGLFADAYFDAGTVEALTGDLFGTDRVEIMSWTAAGAIVLFMPLAEAPAIGDTFNIVRGCGKSRADCMARNNILNFGAFPEVPGNDQIMKAALPGQGN